MYYLNVDSRVYDEVRSNEEKPLTLTQSPQHAAHGDAQSPEPICDYASLSIGMERLVWTAKPTTQV